MYLTPNYRNNTVSPFDAIHSLMDQAFNSRWGTFAPEEATRFPLDMFSDDQNTYVRMEAPGYTKEAFDISVDQSVLSIKVTAEQKDEAGDAHSRTEAVRRVHLSDAIDAEGIRARYEHGVLQLVLPKKAEAQPIRIAIQ